MENEKRRMQGVWNPSVSRTAHIKRKCPAPPDVLISESSFVSSYGAQIPRLGCIRGKAALHPSSIGITKRFQSKTQQRPRHPTRPFTSKSPYMLFSQRQENRCYFIFSRRRFALLSSFHCGQSCCLPLRACQDPAVCFCLKIYLFDQWHSLYLPDIEEPICVPIINR